MRQELKKEKTNKSNSRRGGAIIYQKPHVSPISLARVHVPYFRVFPFPLLIVTLILKANTSAGRDRRALKACLFASIRLTRFAAFGSLGAGQQQLLVKMGRANATGTNTGGQASLALPRTIHLELCCSAGPPARRLIGHSRNSASDPHRTSDFGLRRGKTGDNKRILVSLISRTERPG